MTVRIRRLAQWTILTVACVIALLPLGQRPGYAHDGLKITIEHDGRGSVWATVRWQDNHPVTEEITATLSAREADGQIVKTQAMPGNGPGAIRYAGTLTDGRWTVNVDVTKPGRGLCAAVFAVGPEAAAESVRCDDPPVAPPAAAARAGGFRVGWVTVAALLVAALISLAVLRHARHRRVRG